MCLLCSDEAVYRAYMLYLDEMERGGEQADPEQAMIMALKMVETEQEKAQADLTRKNPHNPFICDPVDE
ncbi:MAG: hypothetical protein EPO23_05105 [Xanthobacteraceae bacterium]|nr:MAG: hypothetical protein EPO23_05105 [Xanthobacteraceae bacterium]